jgi:uncharacterized membrane-anchored protein
MCGANTGDFLSHNLHLGHWRGLAPLAVVFLLIVWAERRARIATEAYYWLAIIVLRTAATNLADLATHDFGLGYSVTDLDWRRCSSASSCWTSGARIPRRPTGLCRMN